MQKESNLKVEKTKKSAKKRKKTTVVETSDEEEEVQVKPQKKKKTKKKTTNRYATVFEPRGIPLPREYETVPVDTLRQEEEVREDGKPCRRSKRARCSPLAFWKNEKMQYGPSDMDANSDVAKMPIPKAIIKAKATPYKPRIVQHRPVTASTKKKGKAVAIPVEEARPAKFDSRKLRKKYQYQDDEQIEVWDEVSEGLKISSTYDNNRRRLLPTSF